MNQIAVHAFHDIRAVFLTRRKLALFDVCEEGPFALAHPLFAANLPLSRLELRIHTRIPRHDTSITIYNGGGDLAPVVTQRLLNFGYSDVALLDDGLFGWRNTDGKPFRDVNVPSKTFGEPVEIGHHTPSLAAEEVQALLDARVDTVILNARRLDEHQAISILNGINMPDAKLVLRVAELALDSYTRVIASCAGHTRSIIGTQSLLNAGIPNPVAALRSDTIGWTLAGRQLGHGQTQHFGTVSQDVHKATAQCTCAVASRTGVERLDLTSLAQWQDRHGRTIYLLDIRTPEEYGASHLPGSRFAPDDQLIQGASHVTSVYGACPVLMDDGGIRTNIDTSWLTQMGRQVVILDGLFDADFNERGAWSAPLPKQPRAGIIDPATLADWLGEPGTQVFDFIASTNYAKRHIPDTAWILRSQLKQILERLDTAERYVLACGSGLLAHFAVAEIRTFGGKPVLLPNGDTNAWVAADLPTEDDGSLLASPRTDHYRRPYEGTDNLYEAVQDYPGWKFGLMEQFDHDGAHDFFVI